MEIKEFEELKKKQESLHLLKAREETKLESLEKELSGYVEQLRALGIEDLDNAEELLAKKEAELKEQYDHISSLLSQFES